MKSNKLLKVLICLLCLILTACGAGVGGGGGGGGGGFGDGTADNARVSLHTDGTQGDDNSHSSSISSDGRYVAFASDAENLVAGDTNNFTDIFLRDRDTDDDGIFDETGEVSTIRVSIKSDGSQATGGSSTSPAISSDGRYVAFASDATNLLTGPDSNISTDIFVHDLNTSTTIRVSVQSDGTQATGDSTSPAISSDGRYVAFASDSVDLIGSDSNGNKDIFVHDRDTDDDGIFDETGNVSTVRASVKTGGDQVFLGDSDTPSISTDGVVAFASDAFDLVVKISNTSREIYVHDLSAGETTRISENILNQDSLDDSFAPSISADGRYVTFESDTGNLVADDSQLFRDIFLHDRDTGTTTRVSVDSTGFDADSNSYAPAISSDGRNVVFESDATDIVTGDTNNMRDIFIRDLDTGITTRMSLDLNSSNSDNHSFAPSVSSDGSYVAFESIARDIVSGDNNNYRDIFVNTD
ncbi:MAG: hypothetical protein ABFR82_10215 [Nitrospirota bacterium]